jgi:hypothetical protein
MKKNLITNNELINTLNIRIDSSAQGNKSGGFKRWSRNKDNYKQVSGGITKK